MKKILVTPVLLMGFFSCKTASTSQSPAQIEGTYWVLTELMGKPVTAAQPNGKDIHIQLDKNQHRIQGFAGCNGFGGNYELKEGGVIRFSQMIGTMMACDALDTENALLKALEQTDNYTIAEGKLSLNKARMAPLARFTAGKPK